MTTLKVVSELDDGAVDGGYGGMETRVGGK